MSEPERPYLDAYNLGFDDGRREGWRFAFSQFQAWFIANGCKEAAEFARGVIEMADAMEEAEEAKAEGRRFQ